MATASQEAKESQPSFGQSRREKGEKFMDDAKQPTVGSEQLITANCVDTFPENSQKKKSKDKTCMKEKGPFATTTDIDTESTACASAQNGKASTTCKDWERAHLGDGNGCSDTDPSTSEIYSDSTAKVESIARDDRWSDGTNEHANASPKPKKVNPDSETTRKNVDMKETENDAGEGFDKNNAQLGASNGTGSSASSSATNDLETATNFEHNDRDTLEGDAAQSTTAGSDGICVAKKAESPSPSGRVFGINEILHPKDFFSSSFNENGSCLRRTESKKHSHCNLCPPSLIFFYWSKALRHIEQIRLHTNKVVAFKDYKILPCKLFHIEKSFKRTDVYHFHSPLCNDVIQQRQYFPRHLEMHEERLRSNLVGDRKTGPTKTDRWPLQPKKKQSSSTSQEADCPDVNNEERWVVRENSDHISCAI